MSGPWTSAFPWQSPDAISHAVHPWWSSLSSHQCDAAPAVPARASLSCHIVVPQLQWDLPSLRPQLSGALVRAWRKGFGLLFPAGSSGSLWGQHCASSSRSKEKDAVEPIKHVTKSPGVTFNKPPALTFDSRPPSGSPLGFTLNLGFLAALGVVDPPTPAPSSPLG